MGVAGVAGVASVGGLQVPLLGEHVALVSAGLALHVLGPVLVVGHARRDRGGRQGGRGRQHAL